MSSESECDDATSVQSSSSDFQQEVEGATAATANLNLNGNESYGPYADEPRANQDWIRNYRRRRREESERTEMLALRLNGTTPIEQWCKCGNCNLTKLAKPKECCCCSDLEAVNVCLSDKRILADLNDVPKCVTEHPAFEPVILGKWSLRQAADRYRTREKSHYKNTGDENKFLRAISYREFTRLVHGRIGNKRIPLPACAYNKIRQKFPSEEMTGYESDSD
ncbi:uncharacterized protein LOC135695443 [Rhopilema esculentum]|uniref:uncharacterized protein LOC135695443 n=1 Tax=Rhopilema esculentum TaxID=499914 RepID=UPI0031D2C889